MQSSTWRELKAVCLALVAFAGHFSNARVIWYSGNQNVESILLNASRKLDLQVLAFQAFQICLKYRISLDARWILRDLNVRANSISKLVDFDDYAINDVVFQSTVLMITGDRIPLTGSTVVTIPNCQGLIPSFFSPAVRQLTPFLRTGDTTITGCVPNLSNCQSSYTVCLARRTLILLVWKSSYLSNVYITDGVHWSRLIVLLLTGSTCPSSRDYLSKGKHVVLFLAPDPLIWMLLLCSLLSLAPFISQGVLHFALWKVCLL